MVSMVGLVGCGGEKGGKDGAGKLKTNLKSNEFVGSLPSIQANYENSRDAAKAKNEKAKEAAMKSQDFKKLQKASDDYDKASKENRDKYEAAQTAEWAKIGSKSVPFTMSEEFKKLNIEVSNLKLNADQKAFSALIAAKEDFVINSNNMNDYQYAYYKVLAKDGSVIDTDMFFLTSAMDAWKGIKLTKGQSLHFEGKESRGNVKIDRNTEQWADFASIQFVTQSEQR
jgi:hypothetical protein